MTDETFTREAVRKKYAGAALRVLKPAGDGAGGCCGSARGSDNLATSAVGESVDLARAPDGDGGCCGGSCDPVTSNLYSLEQLADLPEGAIAASLGCGNPTALAELRPGEIVLDLGSGGGIDVLLSARRVGPSGKAYGLDMTDEMLELARQNATTSGVTNVEFLKGQIENVPLPDNSVDVIISNCVINLSTDKGQVLREAFRVLKPGGRFAVSDVVVDGPVPDEIRQRVELWVGCIAGALDLTQYQSLLAQAGFVDVTIEPTRHYALDDAGDTGLSAWLASQDPDERERLNRAFMSAFVRARKPES